MAFKHALVVDDSRSARVSLKLLLEKYSMAVHFAESGEEAIEFLKSHLVDVIFMDHSMPGMDGFEAMAVIKADPRTATIPVMMYTAKEGEVYVGQARALGAVGVLPKQVQPGMLFDMLLKLGLVKDRRAGRRKPAAAGAPAAEPESRPPEDQAEILLERQALGMSIQALIKRILEDQHLELRSDILAGNRDFAKRVAEEIRSKQQAEEATLVAEQSAPRSAGSLVLWLVLLLGLLPAAVLFMMFTQARIERDTLRVENSQLAAMVERRAAELESLQADLASTSEVELLESDTRYGALLEALQWAVNQGNYFGFDELAFDDVRLERLRDLLARLRAIGFTGTVRLDAHLGEFCLSSDSSGLYRLAEPETPIAECELIGHPLGASASPGERQSVGFANFLATSPLVRLSGIDVQVIAHDSRDSVRRYPFTSGIRNAGDWNRVAELNNRVEFTLIPR